MGAIPTLSIFLWGLIAGFVGEIQLIHHSTFGSFREAVRVTVSPQGSIYVADRETHQITLFKNLQSEPVRIGGYGWQPTSFDRPTGIVTDGLSIYIADYGNHRIQRFDRNLNYVSTLLSKESSDPLSNFGYPLGVAVSRFGDLFILDGDNLRVLKFKANGVFERSFGSIEQSGYRLRNPVAVTVASQDRVLVLEPDRLLEFDYFGNTIRILGDGMLAHARACAPVGDGYIVATGDRLHLFSADGSLSQTIHAKELIADEPITQIKDIAVHQQVLFLLTSNRCFLFETKRL
jgi:DNA-binding beta-propeller fold protein YncE